MNKLILGAFLALCCLSAVRGLSCNTCAFKALSFCFKDWGTVACSSKCATTTVTSGSIHLFKTLECRDNCTDVSNVKDNIFKFNYTTACCTNNLCNSASSAQLALPLAPAMAVVWFTKHL
ncbi:ly-6/neurotoxin-like protein 1 [Ambystoma mexicanum]|uniref:ly-6/neurotoxin-like protein 1 n=1 Tax=Ambystoma mexicanum TaxID=8296 RepID=UPI0037E882F5